MANTEKPGIDPHTLVNAIRHASTQGHSQGFETAHADLENIRSTPSGKKPGGRGIH